VASASCWPASSPRRPHSPAGRRSTATPSGRHGTTTSAPRLPRSKRPHRCCSRTRPPKQAFILLDLGEVDAAVEQLVDARYHAERHAPALLRSWLAAAHGEGLAAAGRRDEALQAFDTAGALLPVDPEDPALPFLFLGGAHLDRWRGHALSRLGERDAIERLSDALPRLPADFVRARTGMLVDLAHAYAAAGDRDAALDHARQAKRLAAQIKSDRQLRRLAALVLPVARRQTP